MLTAIAAIIFLFVLPGLLGTLAFRRWPATRATAHAWSLIANTGALVLLCLVLRNTTGIHRTSLSIAWLGWIGVLALATWRTGRAREDLRGLWRGYGAATLVGAATIVAAILLLFPEQFSQCFNEDGTETHELARSLRTHLLPHWELETWDPIPGGRMGTVVVNPSLVNSYWTCALQTLMGEGEAATRLPYWVWWAGIFMVSCRMVRREGGPWHAAVPLALLMFLVAVLFTFYVGWNPYMADLANPGVPDALFTLLVLLGFDCLRQRDRWGWALAMLLASLVLYAGPVMIVLTLVAAWWWKPIQRRETLRWALRAGCLLAAVAALYVAWGWRDGSLPYWIDTLDMEYLQHYLADVPRWTSVPLFLGYFLLGSGGVTAIGLVWAFRRDAPDIRHTPCAVPAGEACRIPWQRTVATVTLLYLLIVLGAGFKNLHWLAPLWPVPVVLFLMPKDRSRRAPRDETPLAERAAYGARSVVATLSLLVCIAFCWPAVRQTFTLNRQLGGQTAIATDSDLTAAVWGRVRKTMRDEGTMSWDCDEWSWAVYSRAEWVDRADQDRPLLLTDSVPQDPRNVLLASRPVEGTDVVARLYCRDDAVRRWLATRRPLLPAERYPLVFRPLAKGIFSPHDNGLPDVRRLEWPGE